MTTMDGHGAQETRRDHLELLARQRADHEDYERDPGALVGFLVIVGSALCTGIGIVILWRVARHLLRVMG